MADYGAYVVLCLLLADYGKAETCCCDWAGTPPPVKRYWLAKRYAGVFEAHASFSVSP